MRQVAAFFGGCVFLFGLFLFLMVPGASFAQDCEQWAARMVSVQGTVEVQKAGESDWQAAKLDDTYCPGAVVRVGDNSRANLALSNQSVLRLDEGSELTLQGLRGKTTSVVDLFKGAGHFFSRDPKGLEVTTPYTIAGVRGTEFLVRVEENQTYLSVFEGAVLAENDAGSLTLQSGQSAVAVEGQAPVIRVVAKPRDAVQWALYFPPVVYTAPGETPPDESDPRFYTRQASELLAVGRVKEANANIQQALTLAPDFADALALQSIVAVVQNDKQKALELGQKAVAADASSATAHIALSYAQQANFDLAGARDSLQKAVAAEPENALAWARLAEIQMGFGRVGEAQKSAQKAVDIAPNLSRTQTVLGFAYLAQVKTKESLEAFNQAIKFDQADPLPRLGLGLAKIRDGNLAEGRAEIETAASLDPNNSLIRSYLGKAYFEEKRTDLDGREYEVAKQLDPNDPTPYFYDAIRKQTINRPVEALKDVQKAKELNDNRKVFRSKLQLDADLAARSASQARIYNDLGFGQLGLVEGYDSVNTDPTNFSAHRFLADTYATLPRHEIARVSELLQSQLLQPINITPIQPQLAESNLFLISSSGAAQTSFNEFNPIFNRDRLAVQTGMLVGEQDTWGGDVVVSAINQNLSVSAGASTFQTDGWRENADQQDDIANVFAQWEITHKTSIQAEFRDRDTERGDTQLRFFEDDFLPNKREKEDTQSIRFGIKHSLTPDSHLIANLQYSDAEFTVEDEPVPNIVELETLGDEEATSGEIAYLQRLNYVQLVAGTGYFNIDAEEETTTVITPPPIPNPFPPPPFFILPPVTEFTDIDRSVDHFNGYVYSYIEPLNSLAITLGASYDDIDYENDQTEDQDQFNPKFGITWKPIPQTTLRGAVFTTLKRTLISNQTLEPTQVAGFNQFYDDPNTTQATVYGGALDQRITLSLYGGIQYTHRDLDVPFTTVTAGEANFEEAVWDEDLVRAYLFWTPHEWFGLSTEYRYEKFDRDDDFNLGAREVETHKVPLGIHFFHTSGLSASLIGTYIDQEGRFTRQGAPAGTFEDGEDDFWLLDASISYRLPKRNGIITVGATNLTDEEFEYWDSDINNPSIQPTRFVFANFTLAFP